MDIHTLTDIQSVSVAIRDAVAPVFLLTGVGSLLGVLVNRLGRAVDRARILSGMNEEQRVQFNNEFNILIQRTRWIRRSIGLITLAALCICVSITSLFIEVKLGLNAPDFITLSFIAAMLSLIFGLLCFLREIALASRELLFINLSAGK
jgi:phage-related protein